MVPRLWMLAAVVAVGAAACSGTQPLALDGYVEAMQAVEDEFATAAAVEGGPEDVNYPLERDLVYANDLFAAYQDRVRGWESIIPPVELADAHQELTAALQKVQDYVGKYIAHASIEGSFHFGDIAADPEISRATNAAVGACRQYQSRLSRLSDTPVRFAGGCNF